MQQASQSAFYRRAKFEVLSAVPPTHIVCGMEIGMVIETYSSEETFNIGVDIGKNAKPGEVYCLSGDLGVGKTVFSQGFAEGVGVDDIVNSPTFTIVQVYEGTKIPLYHFDVYRIEDVYEMEEIGYEEYFYGEGVCLIEWAEYIKDILPENVRWIKIEKALDKDFDYRKITLEWK